MIKQHFPNKRSKMCLNLLMLMTLTILFSCSVLICMLFGAWHCWKKGMHGQQTIPRYIFFKKSEREKDRYPGSRLSQAACSPPTQPDA